MEQCSVSLRREDQENATERFLYISNNIMVHARPDVLVERRDQELVPEDDPHEPGIPDLCLNVIKAKWRANLSGNTGALSEFFLSDQWHTIL